MKRILSIIAGFLVLSSACLAAGLPRYEIGDVGTNESQAAVIVGNRVAITGAGSKIISFMSGKATGEVAYIDKDGNLSLNGAISTTGSMSAGTLNVTTLNATTAAIGTANITNEVITGTSTIEVADITTAGITNLNVTGTATIAAADISSGVFSSVRSATFEGTSGGVIDGTLTLENSNTTGTATMASAYVSGTVIATSVEGVTASGIDIEANRIIRSDVQLTGSTADGFPNTTTTYIWNIDSDSSENQTDVVGGKVLTVVAGELESATDVLGNTKFCKWSDGDTYLQSTDAAFNVANTADTDDFILGGWVSLPDWTPAAISAIITNASDVFDAHGYGIYIDTAGNLRGALFAGAGTKSAFINASSFTPNTFYHIVFAREVGVATYLFVNGVLMATGADATIGTTQGKFQLGAIAGGNNYVDDGTLMDEVFFRKGVLPTNLADVVRNIYARSAKKFAVKAQDGTVAVQNHSDTASSLISGYYPLKTKVLEIGDWNMDSTGSKSVVHGLSLTSIVGLNIIIRDDTDSVRMALVNSSGGALNLDYGAGATSVDISRTTSGYFDNTSFDSTGYNRGWVIVWYI